MRINTFGQYLEAINSNKPISVVRLGNVEASQLCTINNAIISKMKTNAGWFGKDDDIKKWKNLVYKAMLNADLNLQVVSCSSFFVCNDAITQLGLFIPTLPYSEDIKFYLDFISSFNTNNIGVISNFTKDMIRQSKRIDYIFPPSKERGSYLDKDLCKWSYINSLNTCEGSEPDDKTWLEVFEDLKKRTLDADCDIYLVSCGCYGIPLCNAIKEAGKKAIFVGGLLQLLFGLKGKRWINRPEINKYFNQYWISPTSKPKNWRNIEFGGCYWLDE